jgi:sugar phosphate isomerase/epimerase
VLDFPPALRNEIKSKLADNDLGVACIGSPVGKWKIDEPWGVQETKFKTAVELAHFFDAKLIRIFSYYPPTKGQDIHGFKDEIVKRMRAKCAIIAKTDITLVHENEADIYGEHGKQCLDLLQAVDSPKLRAVFDFANFVIAGDKPSDNWPMLKPFTTHIHIKDAKYGPVMNIVPPGEGDGEIGPILADAYKSGYRGFVTMEPHLKVAGHSHGETGPELFKVAVDALRKVCKEHGVPRGKG